MNSKPENLARLIRLNVKVELGNFLKHILAFAD